MSVITCGYCPNDSCKHCVLMNCAPEHLPELVQMQEERDQLRKELAEAKQMIDELREALRRAVNEKIAKDDERSLEYLQQLHDAKAVIRLLVKVL